MKRAVAFQGDSRPKEILKRSIAAEEGFDLSRPINQQKLVHILAQECPGWSAWIEGLRQRLRDAPIEPILISAGLGVSDGDTSSKALLVALACSLFPDSHCPPYSIGGSTVTEVTLHR